MLEARVIKRFLYSFLPAAALLCVLCYSYYLQSSRGILELAKIEDASLSRLESQSLIDAFSSYGSDLITYANMGELTSLFVESDHAAAADLAVELQNLLASKRYYDKACLLNQAGDELLRVEYRGAKPVIVPGDQLGNESLRAYFSQSSSLQRNQIFISAKVHEGHGDSSTRSTERDLRLITPVYDTHGVRHGLLVMNLHADLLLQHFGELHTSRQQTSLLIDNAGEWLFAAELGNARPDNRPPDTFSRTFPGEWAVIGQRETGQLQTRHGLFTFSTVYPLQAAYLSLPTNMNLAHALAHDDNALVWKIIQHRSPMQLAGLTDPMAQRIAIYTLIFVLLLGITFLRLTFLANEREKTTKELLAEKNKFQTLMERLPEGVVVIQEGRIAYANRVALDIFCNQGADHLPGRAFTDYVYPADLPELTESMSLILAGEHIESIEIRMLAQNGTRIHAQISPTLISYGGEIAVQAIVRDVTRQRMAEAALDISRQRHSLFVAQTNVAVIEWNPDFTVAEWNHGAEQIFGYSAQEARGQSGPALILPPERHESVAEIWQALLSTSGGEHSINENVTRDGRVITCEWYNTTLTNKDNELVGIVSVCTDISVRQQREEELSKLKQAIEHAGESVLITDTDGLIEYVNPAFTTITGYTAGEVIGRTPAILNSGKQNKSFYKRFWRKIRAGKIWQGSLVDRRKDGSLYPALMSVSPVFDAQGSITHFVSIQQDMSEQKELEQKFQQAQKMEALGTLVGGIAHDFNNVLAGMMGNLYLIKQQLPAESDVQEKVLRIEKAGFHAADMIKQLLAFARKRENTFSVIPIVTFAKEAMKLARTSIPENIAMITGFSNPDLKVLGDGTQIQQAMLNLIVNASHALQGVAEPEISLSIEMYKPDEEFIFVHPEMEESNLICLSVSDNGCGIKKDHLSHIFEPFFTTKDEGMGSGLGLAMVYGAMQSHSGVVEVDSTPGRGTTVSLYFPLSEAEAIDDKQDMQNVAGGKGETILLADDNKGVRETMYEVLQSFGYVVLVAENGREALERFAEHSSEIGLALLDIVMPVMGGVDAAEKQRSFNPELPILFLSGYEKDSSPSDKPGTSDIPVLTKPIDLAELSHHIARHIKRST